MKTKMVSNGFVTTYTDLERQVIKQCLLSVYNTIESNPDMGGNYANYENFFYSLLSDEEIETLKTLAENY